MYSLFERVVGAGDADKIPVHSIRAFAGQITRGQESPGDFVAAYSLTPQQEVEWYSFLTKISASVAKEEVSTFLFDWLALAEIGVKPEKYRDEVLFWAALDAVIAGQSV